MLLRSGPFRPSSAEQTELIDQLLDPSLSLQEVSIRNRISLDDLLLWMEEPEVQERLDRLSSLKAKHARRQAQWCMDSCVTALRMMVDEYINRACNQLTDPKEPAQAESKRRSARTAQRAIWLLWRLSSFDPSATSKPRPAPPPAREPGRPRPGGLLERSPDTPANPRFDQEFRRELEFAAPGATGQPSSAGRCSPDPEPIPMARARGSDIPTPPTRAAEETDGLGLHLPPGEVPASSRGVRAPSSTPSTEPPRAGTKLNTRGAVEEVEPTPPPARRLATSSGGGGSPTLTPTPCLSG